MGIPKEPWSRIHIDYAGPYLNNYFLIVVDAYTKWLEVVPTASITAAATSCEGTKLQQEQEPTLPTVVPTEPTNTNMYLPSPIAVRRPQRIRKVPDRLNL
ncbi:Uncharacterized protein K02A2.6 [Eumeta japonica]|uniref:Uncharacterized protein K02A2.6 n=1 Tax=Eumeta variegata TaxID=151549 RepID=A0A4C1UM87_EUMVA|nr:Uncharacterized protein K02A2.6 [Eumeta japonica]